MRDKEAERNSKHLSSVRRGAVILGISVLAVLIAFAGYRTFRRIASAKSRDFMTPFLNSVVPKEDKAAVEGLMLNSKLSLARRLATVTREKNGLAAENAMLKSLEAENRQLRAMAGTPRKMNYTPVFAEVMTRAIPTWRERFVINRGEKSGIAPGDIVVAADPSGGIAVAGRVKEVSLHTAVVISLYSKECRISAMLASLKPT